MFKHIIDEEVELRLFNIRDADEMFTLIDKCREYLREWLPWVDGTKCMDDCKRFISFTLKQFSDNNGYQVGIWYLNKLVGVVGLHSIDWENKKTTIGYWLDKDYQGKGIMTRACSAVLDNVFNELELERVEIRCADKNYKSQAIPQRLGFTKEGVARNTENLYGKFVNHIIYGILKEEWKIKK